MYNEALQPLLRLPVSLPSRLPPLATLAVATTVALFALTLIGLALPVSGLLLWVLACATLPLALRPPLALLLALLAGTVGSGLLWLLMGQVETARIAQLHVSALLAVGLGVLARQRWQLQREVDQLRAALALRDAVGRGLWQLDPYGLELLDGEGWLLAASPAALALWQADGEALLRQQSWLERWGQAARNPALLAWHEMRASGRAEFEASVRTFAGEERQLVVTLQALALPSGQRAVLCSTRDRSGECEQQHALAAKSAQLEQLLDVIDEGFCALDRDWNFRYINDRGAALLQCERDRLIGCNIREIAPESWLHRLPDELCRAMEQGEAGELCLYHPALRCWLRLRIAPDAKGVTLLFRDISAEVESERQHGEHLARLQVEQELADVAGWHFDGGSGQLQLSPKARALLGLTAATPDEQRRQLLELLHPSDRRPLVEGLSRCVRTGCDSLLDVTTRSIDGAAPGRSRHLRWLARRAEHRCGGDNLLVGAVQDISAAVEARERLEFLRTVIDLLPNSVTVIDTRGVVMALNRVASEPDSFGQLRRGQNLLTLLSDVDDERNGAALRSLHDALRNLLQGHSDRVDLEYALRSDDSEQWFALHAVPLQSDGQRLAVISHDQIAARCTL